MSDRFLSKEPSIDSASTRRERKARVRQLLLDRNLETLTQCAIKHRHIERLLNSFLFDGQDLVRWRAVEAYGRVAANKAKRNINGVRETIRRLLWAMNDESGNSVQHAPVLMGEILAKVPELIPEFAAYLPSFHDLSPYQRGVHWAMARIASISPAAFEDFSDMLFESVRDPDPEIRGLGLQALSPEARKSEACSLQSLKDDPCDLEYYDPELGEFRPTTVGEIARQVLG